MNIYCPSDVFIDEVNEVLYCQTDAGKKQSKYKMNANMGFVSKKDIRPKTVTDNLLILGGTEIHFSSRAIEIWKNENHVISTKLSTGISFILKKDEGYIVYFVYEGGSPGAVDTTGKIYSNIEAIEYLKEYDPEKYAESLARAEELGLKSDFEKANVLIWGQTYYSTNNGLEKVFGEPIYGHPELVQYDNQGYGYQVYLSNFYSYVQIVSNENKTIHMDYNINRYTNIFLSNDDNIPFSASWYVGYGGNIYYYIAGEEYTEVFRIRRTWGNPDMYAMAINGYTEDNYGEYVKNTLATMSKSDLRLLRNTIFALYGVHFKSEDLSAHFAKEVWYTDEGKTSGEVDLPPHRQKLVEMIQELERK